LAITNFIYILTVSLQIVVYGKSTHQGSYLSVSFAVMEISSE